MIRTLDTDSLHKFVNNRNFKKFNGGSYQEYILKSWSLVKIGTTSAQKKLFFSLGKVKRKISNMYSRAVNEGDYQEIADELGVSVKEVGEMSQRLSGRDESLNRSVDRHDDSSCEMADLIPVDDSSQEELLSNNQVSVNRSQLLLEAMRVLNEREAKILTARKLDDSPSTLDNLSCKYSISKERVRQIENRAFEKVQAYVLDKMACDGQIKSC